MTLDVTPHISVLTPSFDRAALLARLHASLQAQTFRDFEWLVVDDGSTDDTADVVTHWARRSAFPIRLLRQPNAGKHAALNLGLSEVHADLCATIDSDDWYVPGALEVLLRRWEEIPPDRRRSFANVECRCETPDGRLVGTPFGERPVDH